ncbi:MAG: phosphoribosylglycinamide formyltransferase [Cytophagales bacterium]|nr:phosphoribosylglycinamide formyltransferase [Cytophagales bacterium]
MNHPKKVRLAILASGTGTNAEAIMRHFVDHPDVTVALVLSNNPQAMVLERARNHHVPSRVFSREQFKEGKELLAWLHEAEITHIILAGFLWLIPTYLIQAFSERIINIHPSLLPRHGGKGMYGLYVHQSVLASGDAETGITIHLVNEEFDSGKIIFQASCQVEAEDTPETIASRVHHLEHTNFPRVIEQWVTAVTPA